MVKRIFDVLQHIFMSKRALKTHLSKSPKKALEEQILELYEKFPAVKTYYDFAFNPKEDKLVQDAKAKTYEVWRVLQMLLAQGAWQNP